MSDEICNYTLTVQFNFISDKKMNEKLKRQICEEALTAFDRVIQQYRLGGVVSGSIVERQEL